MTKVTFMFCFRKIKPEESETDTLLYYASKSNAVNTVVWLLHNRADVIIKTKGQTAREVATEGVKEVINK